MDEYIKKEDAIEAVTSLFRVSALFSGMNDNEKEWREKAEKVLSKCEVVTDTADTPQTEQTEPQTEVETMSCQECKHWIFTSRWGWFCPLKGKDECNYEPIEDEPQTERSE